MANDHDSCAFIRRLNVLAGAHTQSFIVTHANRQRAYRRSHIYTSQITPQVSSARSSPCTQPSFTQQIRLDMSDTRRNLQDN